MKELTSDHIELICEMSKNNEGENDFGVCALEYFYGLIMNKDSSFLKKELQEKILEKFCEIIRGKEVQD